MTDAGVGIRIEHLSKSFDGRQVLKDVSFAAAPGRVTGFLGPNGAGKTTTLRILVGLAAPDAGSATFDGTAFVDLPDRHRTVGVALEGTGFHPGRSGEDHLRIQAYAAGIPRSRVDEMVALVGLTDAIRRRVGTYSLGMTQRLGLAHALLADPAVLVLDEPTNGLDPAGVLWLRDLMRSQAQRGKTVIVSSHLLSEVEQTVDDIVIIDSGTVCLEASLDTLRSTAEQRVQVMTIAPDVLVDELRLGGHRAQVVGPGIVEVLSMDPLEVARVADARGISVGGLQSTGFSLERIYMETVGSSAAEGARA